ncbi:Dam family site-specific DNA-(adenine-N6)-methyltransferase [Citrobacter cronae]|uniref:Dam family site-specific DNA-(adenine-N6)-methyltransferase n=1 Tax=Citrobacter cronae TaxID=1748967 RepID=UPI00186743A1|nr:Dam family site-specific DNA-(adenine-N6)-methyltransferase [Citrobacter cronae]
MTGLSYGSVCSGIEAASIAWEPLGMRPAWFAEIEPFPCAVLAARWPEISNLGDMTQIAKAVRIGDVKAPDVVVGGTPCQAFSVAGLRNGLSDTRGQLTLSYVELANAIDDKRRESGESETIFVWENVPGVLSSKDNAFGCFLAGLGGEDEPFELGERPAKGKNSKFWRWDKATNKHIPKWPKSGFLVGRQRRLAWRVLDAQYVGVAQRRKRVFVVASARKDFDPSKILFEFEGVRRDSPPSREPWQTATDIIGGSFKIGSHWDNPANPHPTLNQSHNTGGIGASNQEIFAQRGAGIVGTFRMCAFGEYADDDTASTVKARDYKDATDLAVYSSTGIGSWSNGDVVGTLRAIEQESHEHISVVAFPEYMSGTQYASAENIAPSLMALNPTAIASGNMAVRRLTPVECERLQGFPDNHTLIPVNKRNKLIADELAYLRSHFPDMPEDEANFLAVDGPRYKAIGNSMAVPVMRWIGERIVKSICVSDVPAARTKPFLKWAGGKYSVIDDVLAHLPSGRRLIEPFAGGGSVFLNAGFAEVIASDACDDLILTYQVMQREPFALIDKAAMMFREGNNSDYFDKIKARFNKREMTQMERAAAFIYLNRHCYNGLMRYNLKGEFNVGFGSYRQPYFPLAEMESFATLARNYTFALADYSDTVALAGEGDVVFCDPPYEPMPGKSGFTNYSGQRFRFEDQACLAQALKSAHQRGASVVVTNSGAPAINELYKSLGFRVMSLRARRSISCAGDTRETVTDIIGVLA